jgi:tRNA(fMet)-specific endonuclease VapC
MARLIDTTVLIEAERRGHSLSVIHGLAEGESVAMSSISAAELLLGVERADSLSRRQQRLEFVDSVLADIPVLPFDLDVARVHARVSAHLLATGQPIARHDVMIAATALAHGYAMLTQNLRDFERVPGLVVQAPSW